MYCDALHSSHCRLDSIFRPLSPYGQSWQQIHHQENPTQDPLPSWPASQTFSTSVYHDSIYPMVFWCLAESWLCRNADRETEWADPFSPSLLLPQHFKSPSFSALNHDAPLSSPVSCFCSCVPFKSFSTQQQEWVFQNKWGHALESSSGFHFPENQITHLWISAAPSQTIFTFSPRIQNPVFFQFQIMLAAFH